MYPQTHQDVPLFVFLIFGCTLQHVVRDQPYAPSLEGGLLTPGPLGSPHGYDSLVTPAEHH